MARHYSKQGCLLPKGCKDPSEAFRHELETGYLAEVSKERSANGFMIRARLPSKTSHEDIEITVKGRNLHISGPRPGSDEPSESVIEVPTGYEINGIRAIYMAGSLRIIVPRE